MATLSGFSWSPTPDLLQWLSGGQWANRLLRSQRLYYLLRRLYGPEAPLAGEIPQLFRYRDLAQRLFAPSHGSSETASAAALRLGCQHTRCLCQQTGVALLFEADADLDRATWVRRAAPLAGLSTVALETVLEKPPFGVVHRALREDLKLLAQQGWLRAAGRGKWATVAEAEWPKPPESENLRGEMGSLSRPERLLLLRSLDSVAFVQPQLEVLLDQLWRQTPEYPARRGLLDPEPTQRIFIHLDYILPDAVQEQVDTYQQQIEALWQTPDGGVIQFDNWSAQRQQRSQVTVYPVCLHYARRAKYLSAYGLNPTGRVGWYNYRLDRILSPRLRGLPWGDPQVPTALKQMRHCGQLPTPEQVQVQLDDAWGFNFYLPRALLILRFPPEFARWYVQDTVRHPTFAAVAYAELAGLIKAQVPEISEQQSLLSLVAQRPNTDAYYRAWMRVGDVNVTMRLRDWRPMGEVIAPLVVRQQMVAEAREELGRYGEEQPEA
ncbi:TIGR03985 family CRISPR-associated protein [Nodosilinea sp. LEGE 07088]|uniref:TIGR03985 family CRISPR-associated protein n=1 Tax=Nodosilinea sp. LEGE 07088 TaxID=2777968 RepID=UPI00187E87B2|nr:TIGR03985 family CRISPR-associated protein [Nodosilinea sp. LEGE 07088]MBE9138822.1 TIGR03985 family CRISPR-associated protein [Nodosilinea sp. LEGE 07088]